jgi:hypothetical protein
MQVQKHYTTHNTSATIEFREPEIEFLGERIYQAIQNDEGLHFGGAAGPVRRPANLPPVAL